MATGLDLNETDDGLIVYETVSDRVHYLNQTASVILALCDGTRDETAIAESVAREFGLESPPKAETRACLARLANEGLVR
jgi:PqqD family protein of HPr-rel-A system